MEQPGIGRMVVEDFKRGEHSRHFKRDLRDVYRFYLSEDERERLGQMRPIKRWIWISWWLARNLLRRLSPNRRLILVFAAFLFFFRPQIDAKTWHIDLDFSRVAFPLAVLVLALELKDKLLARDEIEVARQVQISLLPKTQPTLPGWELASATIPANDVGGDLIDYLDGASGRLGIALGDVAGKGMGAALLCAKLQATLRALAPQAASLEHLGAALNGVLERSGLDNRYATLFYAEIESGSGELRYLNAGHNPALQVTSARIDTLSASSLPLGMLPGTAYGQGTATLGPGDLVVLYSDGITEATDAEGSEFGLERLQACVRDASRLAPGEIVRRVL
ncbi:MAG TPA: PP2C family protein-serine/threonine phosphatase, partial [Candidatus Polarisedimenticolaceae bacterium]|nr:PP2C family protein-serine/threonine phosphatase [Candidatus Polarisedimenticolaceae bacterium]